MDSDYSCTWEQLFNCFGAPGIPNEYMSYLYRNGKLIDEVKHYRKKSARKQCEKWAMIYGAKLF